MSDMPHEEPIGLIAVDPKQAIRDEVDAYEELSAAAANPSGELTVVQAQLVYQMLMAGLVSRLFLYLYGELDRIRVEMVCEAIEAHRLENRDNVYTDIVERGVGPLRAVYEHLIAEGLIEREALGAEANAHLDLQDKIQSRIVKEPSSYKDMEDVPAPPTYSVPAAVNMVHVGPVPVPTPLGPCDPSKVTFWGGKVEAAPDSALVEISNERARQMWDKMDLNGNIPPGAASRYTLLYKPPSELGE